MKRLSFLSLLTILFVGMTFVSCSDDDDDNDKKEPTVAEQYAGTYSAIDNLNVGGNSDASWNSATEANVEYTVTANADSTINLTVPAEEYKGLNQVGDFTLSSYTIKNIAWDATKNAFYRKYGEDNISVHFTSTTMHLDSDFTFVNDKKETNPSDASSVTVSLGADGKLNVKNAFMMGRMPVVIYTTFAGTKK